ncbi:neurochondrin-like isoform X1 [Chenopodium quinoa]|uniref:neurochondrin-like isoform X1 n=2 Tax=Chenopodium quinoa TaxID=63459 RepID=UPI000B77816D|nr:neurochondrin-like isoform X1 [Chenopodium quinoa]
MEVVEKERKEEQQTRVPMLEDCLKLLRGETDEKRLAGLLLVTRCCDKNDQHSIVKVYDAIGVRFLHRLLRTGVGKGNIADSGSDNRDAYLHLCITVLAAFCRVPEIAASEDMVSKIPLILEIMEKESSSSILEECYEILFLTSSVSDKGVATLYESGGLRLISIHLPSLPDGSQVLELSLRLLQLILSKVSVDVIISRHLPELATMVVPIARQFALFQNALKFDLLQLLCVILSSDHSVPLKNALRAMSDNKWSAYVRAGIMDILQNRVAAEQKIQALIVAEAMLAMLGEGWLIVQLDVPDLNKSFQSERCLLLVLESARVEIAVLLNELAYLKYEAASSNPEAFLLKRRNLAIVFSLVENIIKLISNLSEDEESIISEGTFTKVISGLNETVEVVLEYLKDAKDHGQKKGDDLLASVRLVGSYLAEAPLASKEKVEELLAYLLSIEGENEFSPFLSRSFLLPMICQATMTTEGVKMLASSGAYKAVMEYFVHLMSKDSRLSENSDSVLLICDTVINFLLKREHIKVQLDEAVFVQVLKALTYWTEGTSDSTYIMMASSICSLIFDNTSEKALLTYPGIDISILHKLSQLIARSLVVCAQKNCNNANSDVDLHQIIAAGYSRWADRFPLVREAVGR